MINPDEYFSMLTAAFAATSVNDKITHALVIADWLEENGLTLKSKIFRVWAKLRAISAAAAWGYAWDVRRIIVSSHPDAEDIEDNFVFYYRLPAEPGNSVILLKSPEPKKLWTRYSLLVSLSAGWVCPLDGGDRIVIPERWMVDELSKFCDALLRSKAKKSKPTPLGFYAQRDRKTRKPHEKWRRPPRVVTVSAESDDWRADETAKEDEERSFPANRDHWGLPHSDEEMQLDSGADDS